MNKCKLFAISLALLISGCATVPPDIFVFEHLGQRIYEDPSTGHTMLEPDPVCMKEIGELECGHGVSIMKNREIFVGEAKEHWFNKKPWSMVRRQSILVPAVESYAPFSAYAINACEKMHCSDDVDRFKIPVDGLNGIGDVLNTQP